MNVRNLYFFTDHLKIKDFSHFISNSKQEINLRLKYDSSQMIHIERNET